MMIVLLMVASIIGYFISSRSQQNKAVLARQKMIKSTFSIYINNFDDIEFNEKVRKVKDADLQ